MKGRTRVTSNSAAQDVPFDVVVPFYVYAALFFLISCGLLMLSGRSFQGHHFQPDILAITHAMALGWGTMMILGASYQLIPVLIEGELQGRLLAKFSFWLAALGIPFLVYGFHAFHLGWVSQVGGIAVNLAVILYVINIGWSVAKSKTENIHAIFVLTASCWLLITTLLGLLLLFNFTIDLLPHDSLHYLSTHAHTGIVGWFLLLILGVGSRLIPMFLISKYTNPSLLWGTYVLVNLGLLLFMTMELNPGFPKSYLWPVLLVGGGLLLFFYLIIKSYQQRIRKRVDNQMKLSLTAVALFTLPVIVLLLVMSGTDTVLPQEWTLAYGFCIFFGWLSAMILGMTFKTLPFIVWSKVYQHKSGKHKRPDPKDLFNHKVFKLSMWLYGLGFLGFFLGILLRDALFLSSSAGVLMVSAILYLGNVLKVVFHKTTIYDKDIPIK